MLEDFFSLRLDGDAGTVVRDARFLTPSFSCEIPTLRVWTVTFRFVILPSFLLGI